MTPFSILVSVDDHIQQQTTIFPNLWILSKIPNQIILFVFLSTQNPCRNFQSTDSTISCIYCTVTIQNAEYCPKRQTTIHKHYDFGDDNFANTQI